MSIGLIELIESTQKEEVLYCRPVQLQALDSTFCCKLLVEVVEIGRHTAVK